MSCTSSVSRPTSVGASRTKSGRSAVASVMRSSTSRCIRSSSSRASACVARTSSGSSASTSSRCPRTIVSGVRSSWPTSSRSSRCDPNARCSRSSIAFTVRARLDRSSLPVTVMRSERSDSVMRRVVSRRSRMGRSRRPTTNHATTEMTARAPSPTAEYVRNVLRRPDISADRSNATTNRPRPGSPVEQDRDGDQAVLRHGRADRSAARPGRRRDLRPAPRRARGRPRSRIDLVSSAGCQLEPRRRAASTTPSFLPGTRSRMPSFRTSLTLVNGCSVAPGRPSASTSRSAATARDRELSMRSSVSAACSANAVPPAIITVSAESTTTAVSSRARTVRCASVRW